MNTQEVANRFYELAQQGNWDAIQDELFSAEAQSIEPDFAPQPVVKGIEAIKQKGVNFNNMTEEVHGGYCNEPVIAGDFFSCAMGMDCTFKGQGRVKMDEIAVYEVQNGKIVKEQFFYNDNSEQNA